MTDHIDGLIGPPRGGQEGLLGSDHTISRRPSSAAKK